MAAAVKATRPASHATPVSPDPEPAARQTAAPGGRALTTALRRRSPSTTFPSRYGYGGVRLPRPERGREDQTVRTLGTCLTPTIAARATVAGIPLAPRKEPQTAPNLDHARVARPDTSADGTENLRCFAGLYDWTTFAGASTRPAAVNLAAGPATCGSLSKGCARGSRWPVALLNDPAVLFLDEPTSGLDRCSPCERPKLIDRAARARGTIFLTPAQAGGSRAVSANGAVAI